MSQMIRKEFFRFLKKPKIIQAKTQGKYANGYDEVVFRPPEYRQVAQG